MKNANKQKNSISGNNTSGLGRKIALIAVAAVVVIAAAVFIDKSLLWQSLVS